MIAKKDGIIKIPFSDLSAELQVKYGYDPDKAAQYSAEQQALIERYNATVQRKTPARTRTQTQVKEQPKLFCNQSEYCVLHIPQELRMHIS